SASDPHSGSLCSARHPRAELGNLRMMWGRGRRSPGLSMRAGRPGAAAGLGALVAIVVGTLCGATPAFSQAPLTISKSFNPSTVVVGGTATTTLTVTVTNPNASSVSGISFSDTYPAGIVPDQVGAFTCSAGSALFNGSGFALNNVTLGAGAS